MHADVVVANCCMVLNDKLKTLNESDVHHY
jgi:hypothetical protein